MMNTTCLRSWDTWTQPPSWRTRNRHAAQTADDRLPPKPPWPSLCENRQRCLPSSYPSAPWDPRWRIGTEDSWLPVAILTTRRGSYDTKDGRRGEVWEEWSVRDTEYTPCCWLHRTLQPSPSSRPVWGCDRLKRTDVTGRDITKWSRKRGHKQLILQ